MNTKKMVSPSLLSADFANLQRDIEMINNSQADWFHVDVMDGVFVPNISYGQPVIKYIKKHAQKPLDVHLMIVDPDRYIDSFKQVGADILTVHYEACTHLNRTIAHIKEKEMMAGVVLNPHTPVCVLEDIIQECDMVLLMSVNPGFGGQKFIPQTLNKLKELRELVDATGSHALIEIDGGVNLETGKLLVDAGADALVAGNAVFKAPDMVEMIHQLKNL